MQSYKTIKSGLGRNTQQNKCCNGGEQLKIVVCVMLTIVQKQTNPLRGHDVLLKRKTCKEN